MEKLFQYYRIKCLPTVVVPAFRATEKMRITTQDGEVDVKPGEWVIKGVYLYKCKHTTFCELYELAEGEL